jgi:hypothetical protein
MYVHGMSKIQVQNFKARGRPTNSGVCGSRRPGGGGGKGANVQNTKLCCRFFQTRFRSPDRRQYSGSQLWDLVVTSPVIIGRWADYRVVGGSRQVIYTTA